MLPRLGVCRAASGMPGSRWWMPASQKTRTAESTGWVPRHEPHSREEANRKGSWEITASAPPPPLRFSIFFFKDFFLDVDNF